MVISIHQVPVAVRKAKPTEGCGHVCSVPAEDTGGVQRSP